jgi:hypothetical protein
MRNSIIVTSTGLIFAGARDGYMHAWDADTGKKVWSGAIGGNTIGQPAMYEVDGREFLLMGVAAPAGAGGGGRGGAGRGGAGRAGRAGGAGAAGAPAAAQAPAAGAAAPAAGGRGAAPAPGVPGAPTGYVAWALPR